MILQALNEYYQRKSRMPDSDLAPPGFEHKAIPYLVILSADGEFTGLVPTHEGEGKKKVAKTYLVPQTAEGTSGVVANLLWDNSEYVFGAKTKKINEKLATAETDKKRKAILHRLEKQREEFIRVLHERLPQSSDTGVQAVQTFLQRGEFSKVFEHPLWPEIQENGANLTFRLEGDAFPVLEREAVVKALQVEEEDTDEKTAFCLVSGETDVIKRTHPAISGVRGAKSTGALLVSFQKDSGYDSYGKEQGFNAPVGKRAVFAYTTALNHLLKKGSKQRIQVGDASTVFWCATPGHKMETEIFPGLFGVPNQDNPDLCVSAIATLLNAPKTGVGSFEDDGTRFYVLGLAAPAQARLSVRFWHEITVGELAVNIKHYLDDVDITFEGVNQRLPLDAYLAAISPETKDGKKPNVVYWRGKYYDVRPNLGGEVMRSIIDALPYPQTLLASAVRRNLAEQEVTYPRAAIIKAYINRYFGREELKVSLDENSTNTAYRLGRLFAVLERVQEEANPGIRATIRNTYWGAASGTPGKVFPLLINLSNKHLAKIRRERPGRATNLEKLIGSIMSSLKPDVPYPINLPLIEQGSFDVGYYHQKEHPSTYKNQGE